jgi:hypothetical protein
VLFTCPKALPLGGGSRNALLAGGSGHEDGLCREFCDG